ncbi:MAG: hypothetical protein SAJ37_13255 [Oscillatoria sp. PMC 1068.18]|nr:hypothetical protein [Oscillatoria sp. PMC 1076.18]MEC4989691.1 hypothetical protein [Oscillatoria sp. PMC 1068.18]
MKNRVGKLVKPFSDRVDLQLLEWLPIPRLKELAAFEPEMLLICPITPWCLVMGYKLSQQFNCPCVVYFMDDWLAKVDYRWLTGSSDAIAQELLRKATGWLTISEQLKTDLSARYHLTPKQSLVVHNPVDLTNKQLPDKLPSQQGTFKVAYAGSIWAMHYDAVAVVAEAIYQLKCEGKDINLILYTNPSFWHNYQEQWQKWQVVYGSFIPYNQLNNYLQQADLLLVASSFLPENAHLIRSSVLTKITDYMVAGRAILSCGPSYSACNQFIKRWNCGLVCEDNDVSKVKALLLEQMENRYSLVDYAEKAFQVVSQNFEMSLVNTKLAKFLTELAISSES